MIKLFKTKKNRIVLNIIKYNFVILFAFALIIPVLFVNNFTKTVYAVGEIMTVENITGGSADFVVTGLDSASSYSIAITDPSKSNMVVTIKDLGTGNTETTVTITGLSPSSNYTATLKDKDYNTLASHSFLTQNAITATTSIIGHSPTTGVAGDIVTITGYGFTGINSISFGSVSVITETTDDTQITFKIPSGVIPTGSTKTSVFIRVGSATDPVSFTVCSTASCTSNSTGANTGAGSSNTITFNGGLVPTCNTKIDTTKGTFTDPCDWTYLVAMINKIISFLLFTIATPLFALILVYVGWLYLSDQGSAEHKTKAKKILINALLGYIIALAAWLIVHTIVTTLGFTGNTYLGS